MANGIVAGIFFEDEAGGVSESVFESAEPIEPFPDGGSAELLSLLSCWSLVGEWGVSTLDGLAVGMRFVLEISFGELDEGWFGESLEWHGEGWIFGKDLSAVFTSKSHSPGIDDENQVILLDAEFSS